MSGNDLIIRGGVICDQRGRREAEVFVRDGVIADPEAATAGADVLDATGCFVLPGLVDLHTHVRQPGGEDVESIESAARAAAAGGYTCITVMPNTVPPIDSGAVVESLIAPAAAACVEVRISACMTLGLEGSEVVDMAALSELGVHYFVDETRGVRDRAVLEAALARAASVGGLAGVYCLDEELAGAGVAHDGPLARSLGLLGIPAAAEEKLLERYLAVIEALGARAHILSVSTGRSAALIREAKARGAQITAEVSPHHLLLSDESLRARDPMRKMRPPLRTEADRAALAAALVDGTLDIIVTDHAPHPQRTKDVPFEEASFGVTGLETALPWIFDRLDLPLERLVETMSTEPARIGCYQDQGGPIEVGRPANLCAFDPDRSWQVEAGAFISKSNNSPILGEWLSGHIRHTIASGVPVVIDGGLT